MLGSEAPRGGVSDPRFVADVGMAILAVQDPPLEPVGAGTLGAGILEWDLVAARAASDQAEAVGQVVAYAGDTVGRNGH